MDSSDSSLPSSSSILYPDSDDSDALSTELHAPQPDTDLVRVVAYILPKGSRHNGSMANPAKPTGSRPSKHMANVVISTNSEALPLLVQVKAKWHSGDLASVLHNMLYARGGTADRSCTCVHHDVATIDC